MGMLHGQHFDSPASREVDFEISEKIFGVPRGLETPAYSSSVDLAMLVVERMKQGSLNAHCYSFALYSAMHISSVMTGYEAWFNLSVHPPKRGEGWGFQDEEPASAICYAALEAIGCRPKSREEQEILHNSVRSMLTKEVQPFIPARAPEPHPAPAVSANDDNDVCSAEDWHFYHGYIAPDTGAEPDERYDDLPEAPEDGSAT